jgi:hypothetical protein
VLKLTSEQQEQIRRMTGKRISELRIGAVEERTAGRFFPGEPVRSEQRGAVLQ